MTTSQTANNLPVVGEDMASKPVLRLVEITTPDIGDLDNILEESEKVIASASLTEKCIDELIEKRRELLGRLKNVSEIRGQRLQRVQNFDPLKNLKSTDYEGLIPAGIVDGESAEKLKKLDSFIAKLDSLEHPTDASVAELEKLTQLRIVFQKRIEDQIAEKRQEISERREGVRGRVLEHYARQTGILKDAIAEIESNPRVVERLAIIEEQEKKELEAGIEKFLLEISKSTETVGAKHTSAFNRLVEITGNENIVRDLLDAFKKGDRRRQQDVLDKVRNCLTKSIIESEGKQQLRGPKEIVPWEMHNTSISYTEAMNGLGSRRTREALRTLANAGNEQAGRLLAQVEKVLDEDIALRKLIGKKWHTDGESGKKYLGAFWATFETRKENDKSGVTEARKKAQKEVAKQKAEEQKVLNEIIKRGGFSVEFPIVKSIKGTQRTIGKKEGALRLERTKSKKGNECWVVAEVTGAENVLEVGAASPLNMSAFPSCVRESAKNRFIMHGEDFDELLEYESKE